MSKKTTKNFSGKHRERMHRLKNHPFVVPVITFIVLFFVTMVAMVSFNATTVGPTDARLVQVFADGQNQTIPTRARTVQELLDRLGISLNEGDVVEPKLTTQILEDNFSVNVYRARPVTVIDGRKKLTTLSATQSARGVVQELGIELHPEDDVVSTVPDNVLKEGVVAEQLTVSRSIPVKLVLYGKSYNIRTHAKTVAELVEEKGLNQDDITLFPPGETPLKPNTVIFVTYPGKTIVSREETIPMKTETVEDPDLEVGQTRVRQKGSPGKKVVIYEVDKKTKKRKALQTVIAQQPVKRIVVKGTKINTVTLTGGKAEWMRAAGIDPSQYQYVDFVISHESGWNPASVSPNRCIGLGQRCDAQILISACPSWQTDPVCQLRHFSEYANGRYGSWQGAYSAWQVQGWW